MVVKYRVVGSAPAAHRALPGAQLGDGRGGRALGQPQHPPRLPVALRPVEARCHLVALSHDELGVVVEGLVDVLDPSVVGALGATCAALRLPLLGTLRELRARHDQVRALCVKMQTDAGIGPDGLYVPRQEATTPRSLCTARTVRIAEAGGFVGLSPVALSTGDMAAFGMVLRASHLPALVALRMGDCAMGDAGVGALCAAMGPGTLPSLRVLEMDGNGVGAAGAAALGAAMGRGALPGLRQLYLGHNPRIGDAGAKALAGPLRRARALEHLYLEGCAIGDEGVAALVKECAPTEFARLATLTLGDNLITDGGAATLAHAISAGRFALATAPSDLSYGNLISPAWRDRLRDACRLNKVQRRLRAVSWG